MGYSSPFPSSHPGRGSLTHHTCSEWCGQLPVTMVTACHWVAPSLGSHGNSPGRGNGRWVQLVVTATSYCRSPWQHTQLYHMLFSAPLQLHCLPAEVTQTGGERGGRGEGGGGGGEGGGELAGVNCSHLLSFLSFPPPLLLP